MIKEIKIKNFKSLNDIDLFISNLNVLAGLNGSGKSSFLQSLLLLRQSFANTTRNTGLILQGGELISLGSGVDVFYQYAGKDEVISFEIKTEASRFLWRFLYNFNSDILPIDKMELDTDLADFSLFNQNFQYLNAEHISPQVSYKKSEFHVVKNKDIGTKGEYAVHYLAEHGLSEKIVTADLLHPQANSRTFIHQVDAWVSEISPGIRLIAEDVKGLDVVRLAIRFETKDGYTDDIKPINTGFGISYVLPIVIAILKAQKGDILILENPESHLHPRGQSIIGRMMAYAAQSGVQIFVETHSDHIINGMRVAVKNEKLLPENSKIFYFDRISDDLQQFSRVKEILIDKNGELSAYPQGFLDEWNEQLMELI
jgi:predicted ATPase